MSVHLVKLCVGVSEIAELAKWQDLRMRQQKRIFHVTRMVPRRADEIISAGSLYWVIRAMIMVRQRITDIEVFKDEDGIGRCRLIFDPELVPVRPAPRRAFQGWRYLDTADAPPDLPKGSGQGEVPEAMRSELAELGLL